jgi:hypothetical protein
MIARRPGLSSVAPVCTPLARRWSLPRNTLLCLLQVSWARRISVRRLCESLASAHATSIACDLPEVEHALIGMIGVP